MKRLAATCSMLAWVACAVAGIAADDRPSETIPELKALDSYVGSWDVETSGKNTRKNE